MINFDGVAAQSPRQSHPTPPRGRTLSEIVAAGGCAEARTRRCGLWHMIEDCVTATPQCFDAAGVSRGCVMGFQGVCLPQKG